MAVTYEPIASTTLGSAAAEIDLTSIPGTYTDLVLILEGVADNTAFTTAVQFNGITTTTYSTTYLYGTGSAAASARNSGEAFIRLEYAATRRTTSRILTIAQFMSYANTNVFKTVLSAEAGSAEGVGRNVGLWRSTDAISSMKLRAVSPSSTVKFASGTTVSLFGVKAA